MSKTCKNDAALFQTTLDDLARDPHVCLLKNYRQHRGNSTFRHCKSVAETGFALAQRFRWNIDEVALARGAMLHDYHLYTRQDRHINFLRHAFEHPRRACENAERVFVLDAKEKNMIRSHMWPLTLFDAPRSKEAFLVTLADKYCALREMCRH